MNMNCPNSFLQAFDANIRSKFSYLPSLLPNASIVHDHQMLRIDSGLPTDMFNIICCQGSPNREDIQTSLHHFRAKHLLYAFWVGFEQEPIGLEEELKQSGLIQGEMEWAMGCDLTKNEQIVDQPANVSMQQVTNQEMLKDFIATMQAILPSHEHVAIETLYLQCADTLLKETCPTELFVGYENGKPQATASVFFHSGLASIFDVIVLPEVRGRGVGKWITWQAMKHAKAKGVDTCVLTATNDAKYLYEKLGFEIFKEMKVYIETHR